MNNRKLKIHVLHGPNLNLLGEREPEIYGHTTLSQLNDQLWEYAHNHDIELKISQNNSEGILIDLLHESRKWADGIVINPGALTHYSYSLRDAISGIGLPAVEVHLSDINSREDFRRISVTRDVCIAQVSGYGINSYMKGMERIIRYLNDKGMGSD